MDTFSNKDNMNMLWEIISSEDIFKFLTGENKSKIFKLFVENAKGFFESEKMKTHNLLDLNKKYILIILNYIQTNYPYHKIKIYPDSEKVKELITYEEIQNEKKSKIEFEFAQRQEEFSNAMSLHVPEEVDFSDKIIDEPINEMDKIIKEMTAKRNYDVEQINRNYPEPEKVESWLKPQKTSIKSEKFITENQKISLTSSELYKEKEKEKEKEKNVSWGENEEFYLPVIEENIFNKLKKIPSNLENITISLNEVEKNPKSIEERLTCIEQTIESYHLKIDQILSLLENKL
jgi:hypothetical protein